MAESKFDKLFESNVVPPVPEPATTPEKTPRPRVVELANMGGGKTVAAALQAAEALQPGTARPLGRPPGKRSDPAWKQFSVLLKKETHRAAANILREQEQGEDFSGLVQNLVESWIKRQKS
jgi:hypothetical protein